MARGSHRRGARSGPLGLGGAEADPTPAGSASAPAPPPAPRAPAGRSAAAPTREPARRRCAPPARAPACAAARRAPPRRRRWARARAPAGWATPPDGREALCGKSPAPRRGCGSTGGEGRGLVVEFPLKPGRGGGAATARDAGHRAGQHAALGRACWHPTGSSLSSRAFTAQLATLDPPQTSQGRRWLVRCSNRPTADVNKLFTL
jgi:hypothetical protein